MKKTVILFLLSLLVTAHIHAEKNNCAPDKTTKDKITKETYEIWTEKLASSSSFKSATNGKSDFLYYIFFYTSSNGDKGVGINLSQTTPYIKEAFGEDVKFNKGDKILIGWDLGQPLELIIDDIQSRRNVYPSSKTVLNSYFLTSIIKDEDFEKLKTYFLNDHIIGVRIDSGSDNVIETEVKDKKNTKIAEKAKCFFDTLGK